jgi:hypothetical protein
MKESAWLNAYDVIAGDGLMMHGWGLGDEQPDPAGPVELM